MATLQYNFSSQIHCVVAFIYSIGINCICAVPSISVTAPGCFDIEGKRFDVNHYSGKHKGCIWLRNHEEEQAEKCVNSDAKLICKNTCDIGCDSAAPSISVSAAPSIGRRRVV